MFKKILLLVVAFLLAAAPMATRAEESERIEKVVSVGAGETADAARLDAIRNAVEQVIGTYVSSDTMVQNNALIKDEILSFSGGYVRDLRVVATERGEGLFRTKIEASVVSTKLKRKIQALNIATKTVDGGSLFGEALSRVSAAKSGSELLAKAFSKYPQAAYRSEMGKPEITSVNHTTNMAKVKVNVKLSFDKEFLAELETVAKTVAYKTLTNLDVSHWGYGDDPVSAQLKEGDIVLFFTSGNLLARSVASRGYVINVGREMLDDQSQALHHLTREYGANHPRLQVEFCDASEAALDALSFYVKDERENYKTGSDFPPFAFPSLAEHNFPMILQAVYGYRVTDTGRHSDLLFVVDKSINLDLVFEEDIPLLDKVSSMKVNFGPLSPGE